MPETRRFDEPRAVEVLHEGHWWPGFQDAWLWSPDGWRASVEFLVEYDWGRGHVLCVPAGRVPQRED